MAPVGVLADFLEVEDRYEHVVDDFLRDELNYIVVKSWDAADEGLRLLRSDVDGRATFLVHPGRLAGEVLVPWRGGDATTVAQRDSVVPLKHCIRVLDGFGKSLEVILPKLGNGYIVPDPSVGPRAGAGESGRVLPLAVGRVLPQRDRHRRQAAQRRTAVDEARAARSVAAGGGRGSARWREEQTRVAALAREIDETDRTAAAPGRRKARSRAPGNDVGPHAAAAGRRDGAGARAPVDLRTRNAATGRGMRRVRSIDRFPAELSWPPHEEQRQALEAEMQAAQSSLDELRQRRDEAAQLASDARARLATLEERRRGAVATVQRIEAMVAEVVSARRQAEGAD